MANPIRGEVTLQAGDEAFTLSFSVNAIVELEDHLDLPVSKIANLLNDPENVRMKTVRALIWAALRDHHEHVTIIEAGKLATRVGVAGCMEKVGRAFQLAFPDAEDEEKTSRPQKAKAG
ncbi:GTA-gp10 family protein [Chelativorans sp. AA-79]|uniref:GTA-gp10 family protein n=1 Tax=Chelativorans sp. AA-79 TaxID=3028735 RepID=UPI0023F65901|nr:GTA-gp10 family protein [Chelativorans sp. AA-79]WEX07370.1 GTA-gp10 family protein [Chelativorans sp. AA-79]